MKWTLPAIMWVLFLVTLCLVYRLTPWILYSTWDDKIPVFVILESNTLLASAFMLGVVWRRHQHS